MRGHGARGFGVRVRGKVAPLVQERVSQVVEAPVMGHSQKPREVKTRINRTFGPDTKKLELFARCSVHPGWHYWGNEVEKYRGMDETAIGAALKADRKRLNLANKKRKAAREVEEREVKRVRTDDDNSGRLILAV